MSPAPRRVPAGMTAVRDALTLAVKDLVRASIHAVDRAKYRQELAERLLRHLEEGRSASSCTSPGRDNAYAFTTNIQDASVRVDCLLRLAADIEK